MMLLTKSKAGLSGAEARELVKKGAQLLDVRSPSEFQSGHIEGAKNIPVGELSARMKELKEGTVIIVYCRSGARSSNAASVLKAAGFEVHNLGGIGNW